MSLTQGSRQRSGVVGDQNQMDTVGHQTPRQNANAMSPGFNIEHPKIDAPIFASFRSQSMTSWG
jgi:hypothetical protein